MDGIHFPLDLQDEPCYKNLVRRVIARRDPGRLPGVDEGIGLFLPVSEGAAPQQFLRRFAKGMDIN